MKKKTEYLNYYIKYHPAMKKYVAYKKEGVYDGEPVTWTNSLKELKFELDQMANPMTKKRKNSTIKLNPKTINRKNKLYEYQGHIIEVTGKGFNVWDDNGFVATIATLDKAKTFVEVLVQDSKPIRKNISVAVSNNPLMHYPRTAAGRPRGRGRPKKVRASGVFPKGKGRTPTTSYFILDVYPHSGSRKTLIGEGTMSNAKLEAEKWSKKKGVLKTLLSGPYSRKPTKSTKRK